MKRKLFFIILTFTLIISTCSCHGIKALPEFIIPDEFLDEEYNITFWAKNDTNSRQQEIYNEAIEEFNKYYPNINVEIIQYRDYSVIYSDVIKNISTQTTPNVCIAYPDHVATYLDGTNVVVPLDDLMNDSKYGFKGSEVKYETIAKNDIVEDFLNEGIIGDKHYTLPFQRSTEALYINKTYVESLGFDIPDIVSWDFIWEVAQKAIDEKPADKNIYPLIYKSVDNMTIQLLKQSNIEYTSKNKDIYLFNDETKALLLDLQNHANNKHFEIFNRVSYPGNHFNRGNCIFAIDSTAGATWIGGDAPLQDIPEDERVSFETVVRPIPQIDPSNPQMISQGPSICVFNKKDNNEVLASWLFAQFLLNNKTQIDYSQTEGYIPVTHTAINSKEYQDSIYNAPEFIPNSNRYDPKSEEYDPNAIEYDTVIYPVRIDATKIILNNISNTFVTPVFSGSSLVRSAAGYLIEGIFKPKYQDKIDLLFEDTYALYNLNTVINEDSKETPDKNIAGYILIAVLIVSWISIGGYVTYEYVKKRKKENLS